MEPKDKNGLTEKEFLAAYSPKSYERPSVTADIAVFSLKEDKSKILLIKRGGHPYLGYWALPGGFSKKDEPVEETAARELYEETHLKDIPLLEVGLFSTPERDPRMWVMSEAFAAVLPTDETSVCAGDDAAAAKWFDIISKRKDNIITVSFSSDDLIFHIQLKETVTFFINNMKKVTYSVLNNSALAFDHAIIVACAMQKIRLI